MNQIQLPKDAPAKPPAPTGLGVAATLVMVALAALAVALGKPVLPESTWPLVFLIAVLLSAVAFGFWTGLLAAVLAFGGLNFLFTEPVFTLRIAHPQDLIALLVFLLVAALAGLLAGRLHDRAEAARARAESLAILGALSADLAGAEARAKILDCAVRHLAALTSGPAAVLGLTEGVPQVLAVAPPEFEPNMTDLQAAERVFRSKRAEAAAAPGWSGSQLDLTPVSLGEGVLVLGHIPLVGREAAGRGQAVMALLEQLRLALQRLEFAEKARAERLRAETEATRSALLSSLSHDLRTPLATILGAASSLKELDAQLGPDARADLLTAIEEEASRLNRHVTNLLQMTRLEMGMEMRPDWVDLSEIVAAAMTRAARAWPKAELYADCAVGLPMIHAEAGLLEQAIFNLTDNALHHGTPPVTLRCHAEGAWVVVTVEDCGAGLPPAVAHWITSPDVRPAAGQRGLGLAVVKGIARLNGGTLISRGGSVALTFPAPHATKGALAQSFSG